MVRRKWMQQHHWRARSLDVVLKLGVVAANALGRRHWDIGRLTDRVIELLSY
jgi:hypothetical protein